MSSTKKKIQKALNISLCIYYLTRCLIQQNFSEIHRYCIGHWWQSNDFVGIFRRNFRCKTIEASRIGVARFLVLRRCPETGVRRQGRRILEGGHHTRPAPPNAPSQDSIRTSFGADWAAKGALPASGTAISNRSLLSRVCFSLYERERLAIQCNDHRINLHDICDFYVEPVRGRKKKDHEGDLRIVSRRTED